MKIDGKMHCGVKKSVAILILQTKITGKGESMMEVKEKTGNRTTSFKI